MGKAPVGGRDLDSIAGPATEPLTAGRAQSGPSGAGARAPVPQAAFDALAGGDWLASVVRCHAVRFRVQKSYPGLLPDITVALAPLKTQLFQRLDGPATNARRDLRRQAVALSGTFEGRSHLEFLHALCIAYLRRQTKDSGRARRIFRRMWHEEPDFLLDRLSARWLISALQTFYDHGVNPGEKLAGAVGFFYGNLIKVYETERAASRPSRPASPDRYPHRLAAVAGIGGFRPGDDVLLNLHVIAHDAALNGGVAGPVLLRLMQIVHDGDTIFQRTDALADDPAFSARHGYTKSFGQRDGKTGDNRDSDTGPGDRDAP